MAAAAPLEPHETLAVTLRPDAPRGRECTRCGAAHGGLCAVLYTPAEIHTMRWLGLHGGRAVEHARTELRQRAGEILRGVTTRGGRDRERAVANCGRWGVAMVDGVIQPRAMYCGDRFCPSCQEHRSRVLSSQLREALALRIAEVGDIHWFCTLTMLKPVGSDPQVAVALARKFWRTLTNAKTALGREFHRRFAGGIRAGEVTWSARGKKRRDGTRVEYDGWHFHWHILLEGGDPEDMRWLIAQWCAIAGGRPGGQHYAPMDSDRAYQLCKYVVKPLDTDCSPALARELVIELHGKRLHEGFGVWRSWKKWLHKRPPVRIAWADGGDGKRLGLPDLARRAASEASRVMSSHEIAPPAPIVFREQNSDAVIARDVASVVDAVRRWFGAKKATQAEPTEHLQGRNISRSEHGPTEVARRQSHEAQPYAAACGLSPRATPGYTWR